ncbi:MAG: outer membrane lipoprotein-sorting protein [Armatimonadetes bacterium]|nr:outer membrane lipoprotein-sorting protein [Armatimonadota bacterium]
MLIAATLSMLLGAQPTIQECIPNNFKSATFVAEKVKGIQSELAKINKDFGTAYRFAKTSVWLEEPFKLRLESAVEDTSFTFIMNGPIKVAKAPRSKLSIKENVGKKPGKRQTAFDFGLLTPALMSDLFDAKFIREDRATGAYVFDLTYKKSLDDETKNRVWMDPKRDVMLKREWYSQIDGRLMAIFTYSDFVQQNGVNFPTAYEVKNADNKLAGAIRYKNLKLNTPIDDSYFKVN